MEAATALSSLGLLEHSHLPRSPSREADHLQHREEELRPEDEEKGHEIKGTV